MCTMHNVEWKSLQIGKTLKLELNQQTPLVHHLAVNTDAWQDTVTTPTPEF